MLLVGGNVFPTFAEIKKMVANFSEPAMMKFPISPEIIEKWVYTLKLDGHPYGKPMTATKLSKVVKVHDAMEDVKASMEGIVFKPHSPYSGQEGKGWVKEKAVEPPKKKSKALPVGVPKVFRPVLKNPRSVWGQKMKEKLEGKG